MIKKHEILRKVSDDVFQEIEPSANRSRPFEWRRRINLINFPLTNIKIVTSCSIHDADIKLFDENTKEPIKHVKADISEQIAITGIFDIEQIRDSLYFAAENKDKNDLFSIERASSYANVSIRVGVPSEKNEGIPNGLYRGSAFRMNYNSGEDDLYLELTAPKEQMLSLITALMADPNSNVEIGVLLLSYTYEVDDALREYYHPRDIILNESAPCFLSRVGVSSKIGQHYHTSELDYEDENINDKPNQEKPTPEQVVHQEVLQVLLSYSKPLNSLVAAIWVLVTVIALRALFG